MANITYDSRVSDFYGMINKNTAHIEIETAKYINGVMVDCIIYDAQITFNDVVFVDDDYENHQLLLDVIYTHDVWIQYSGDCTNQEHRFTDTSGLYQHIDVKYSGF